jgi:hypothetical protein
MQRDMVKQFGAASTADDRDSHMFVASQAGQYKTGGIIQLNKFGTRGDTNECSVEIKKNDDTRAFLNA